MLDKAKIHALIQVFLAQKEYVLENLEIDEKKENLLVEIDSIKGVDMDFCATVNKYLSTQIDKLFPDSNYSIEVGSVSLTAPFKSMLQYKKHIGDNVKVTDKENKVYTGRLVSVNNNDFVIDAGEPLTFLYNDIQKTEYIL